MKLRKTDLYLAKRERTFPAFYDGDFDFFHVIDNCRKTNKHLTVLKARRKGYSYKAGVYDGS